MLDHLIDSSTPHSALTRHPDQTLLFAGSEVDIFTHLEPFGVIGALVIFEIGSLPELDHLWADSEILSISPSARGFRSHRKKNIKCGNSLVVAHTPAFVLKTYVSRTPILW
jgi:hypothetical protein